MEKVADIKVGNFSYAVFIGGNLKNCPSFVLAKELKALPFVSMPSGKSKKTWRLFL